ncbi:MAG: deoxyhypusine synthase family protein [Nanoarchaeota archaeon]|nr:deoxyhypusine synthase family protein [Nanoarchaeota archaeon]
MKNKVNQMKIEKDMTVKQLAKAMSDSGVMGAGRIGKAVEVFEKILEEKQKNKKTGKEDCKLFFGLAGAMVPGGMKEIIHDMLISGTIDVFVTTGANLTHDLIEGLGYNHFKGNADVDDAELNKKGIDRIYDSFMPNNVYEGLEGFFEKIFDELPKEMNIRELLWEIGKRAPKNTILHICYEKQIPIFCPAISDSGIGLMIWGNLEKGKKLKVDVFDDLKEISRLAWDAKKPAVLYVGGGVPKNYIQQAMQFSPNAAAFGIQITTDRVEPGGSSGAELREGISWGKLNKNALFADVRCDATIALPLIWASVKK